MPQSAVKYVVVEKDYASERVIFGPTSSKPDAERVASQHAARRVIESKGK